MEKPLTLKIDFYNQFECSITVDTYSNEADLNYLELLLFSSYSLRQMLNLMKFGSPLANVLKSIKSPIDAPYYYSYVLMGKSPQELAAIVPLITALGVETQKLVPFMTCLRSLRHQPDYDDQKIVDKFWPDSAKIIDSKKVKPNKSFLGKFETRDNESYLTLAPSGFGILGKGVNYYVPVSVSLFINYLEHKHKDDLLFCGQLAKVANLCGESFLGGGLSPLNQNTVSFAIVDNVLRGLYKK